MTVCVLILVLALDGPAWASAPLESEPGPSPAPDSRRGSATASPAPLQGSAGQRQLRELERRLSVLVDVMIGRGHRRGVIERGLGWSPELQERSFFLYSSDGNFRLHLNSGVQAQYNAFPRGQT